MVQGATEFLPVSSSAHLALAPRLLGFADPGLTFDLALHLGTLAASLWIYRAIWKELLLGAARSPRGPQAFKLGLLALATVPAALAGVLLEDQAEGAFRDPRRIALALGAFSFVMAAADRWGRGVRSWAEAGPGAVLAVGAAQALAIVPGVSRSGATISAALLLGLSRESAAELSFLLATPVIAGAAAFKLRHLGLADVNANFLLGVAVSAATGFAAVRVLLKAIGRWGLNPYVAYRVLLAGAILLLYR